MLRSVNALRLMISPDLPSGLFWLSSLYQLHFRNCAIPFIPNCSQSWQWRCQPAQEPTRMSPNFETPILQGGRKVIKVVFVPYSSRMCILKQHWVTPWNPFTPNLFQHEASTPLSSPLCSSLLISFCIRCGFFASGGFPQSNSQHHLVTGLGIPRRKLYGSLSNF